MTSFSLLHIHVYVNRMLHKLDAHLRDHKIVSFNFASILKGTSNKFPTERFKAEHYEGDVINGLKPHAFLCIEDPHAAAHADKILECFHYLCLSLYSLHLSLR